MEENQVRSELNDKKIFKIFVTRRKKAEQKAYYKEKDAIQKDFDALLDDHFAKKFTDLFQTKGRKVAFNFVDEIKKIRQRNIDAEAFAKLDFKLRSLDHPKQRPHIFFILADDLGFEDVGFRTELYLKHFLGPFKKKEFTEF